MTRPDNLALLNGVNADGTKEVRAGAGLFDKTAAVLKSLAGGGVLTEDAVATVGFEQTDVLKRSVDTVLRNPVKGPVTGLLERGDVTRSSEAGQQGASVEH